MIKWSISHHNFLFSLHSSCFLTSVSGIHLQNIFCYCFLCEFIKVAVNAFSLALLFLILLSKHLSVQCLGNRLTHFLYSKIFSLLSQLIQYFYRFFLTKCISISTNLCLAWNYLSTTFIELLVYVNHKRFASIFLILDFVHLLVLAIDVNQ